MYKFVTKEDCIQTVLKDYEKVPILGVDRFDNIKQSSLVLYN